MTIRKSAGQTGSLLTIIDAQGKKQTLEPCPSILKPSIAMLAGNLLHVLQQHPELMVTGLDRAKYAEDQQRGKARLAEIAADRTELAEKEAALAQEEELLQAQLYGHYSLCIPHMDQYARKDPALARELVPCHLPRAQRTQKKADVPPAK